MKTGHLVYLNKDKEHEVVPFEYDNAPRQAADKVVETLGLEPEEWDYCTSGRYIAVYDETGYDYIECHSTDNCWNRMYSRDFNLYDTVKKRWMSKDPWADRDSVTESSKEAMEMLSAQLFLHFDDMNDERLGEMSEFAEKWGIPFSTEMIDNFITMFTSQFPEWNWNSSSAYC